MHYAFLIHQSYLLGPVENIRYNFQVPRYTFVDINLYFCGVLLFYHLMFVNSCFINIYIFFFKKNLLQLVSKNSKWLSCNFSNNITFYLLISTTLQLSKLKVI